MPTYQTVNGPRTTEQMEQELRNAGWPGPIPGTEGPGTVANVYAQTTGGPVNEMAGQSYGAAAQPASVSGAQSTVNTGGAQLAAGINSLIDAIASGNKQAFDEAVRQFNMTFGLDRDKFNEAIRQFNENLGITQAGLTGTYQGAPTLQAQQQAYAQGIGTLGLASQLQANPFRQQEVLGALGPLLAGRPVPGFQSPTGSAGNTGLGYLQQLIDDIRSPQANQARMEEVLRAIPTPNQLNSVSFFQSPQSTQNLVLQGIQEKYGLNPQDALQQIRNTLPAFQSPSTFGAIR